MPFSNDVVRALRNAALTYTATRVLDELPNVGVTPQRVEAEARVHWRHFAQMVGLPSVLTDVEPCVKDFGPEPMLDLRYR